jgi:hypothetical protein
MNDSGGRGGTALRPSEEARLHDLVELERTDALVGEVPVPDWVPGCLARAPLVVVRRALAQRLVARRRARPLSPRALRGLAFARNGRVAHPPGRFDREGKGDVTE